MPPVLLSAEIRASALRMSKFRGSITFPIFSLSTLSRQHYCSPPKTRYCWLVRPSQTGFSPARLPALRLGAQFLFPTFNKNGQHFSFTNLLIVVSPILEYKTVSLMVQFNLSFIGIIILSFLSSRTSKSTISSLSIRQLIYLIKLHIQIWHYKQLYKWLK